VIDKKQAIKTKISNSFKRLILFQTGDFIQTVIYKLAENKISKSKKNHLFNIGADSLFSEFRLGFNKNYKKMTII